jgi:quercetin dioxygenase-like cupin family protein
MNIRTVLFQSILLTALAFSFCASTTMAQDMAKVAPGHVKVLLDNDKTRVLDVQLKAGEKLPMHSHPGYILYTVSDSKFKTTFPDGKVAELDVKAGDTRWTEKVTHANEAVTDVHVLVIEFKEQGAAKKK